MDQIVVLERAQYLDIRKARYPQPFLTHLLNRGLRCADDAHANVHRLFCPPFVEERHGYDRCCTIRRTDGPSRLDLPLKGYPLMVAQVLWTVRRTVARQIGRRRTHDGFEFA